MAEPDRDPAAARTETPRAHPAVPAEPEAGAALRPPPYRVQERLVAAALVVLIAAAAVIILLSVREHASALLPSFLHPLAQRVGLMRKPPEMKVADPVGAADARVEALVVMEHCLVPVQDLLVQIATAYPHHLRASFVSMYTPTGQRTLGAHQESCAGVYINDKDRFQVTVDGVQQEVYLHGMPGSSYRLAHVAAAVRQEILAAYGAVPADFDSRIVVKEMMAPTPGPGSRAPGAEPPAPPPAPPAP